MRFDSAMDDGQTKAAPAALGCNEWLEQSILDRIWNSPALVGHTKHYRPARKTLGLLRKLMLRELGSFDSNFASRGRRLNGVEQEIEDRAMEQIIIANDDHRGRRKQLDDCDSLGLVWVGSDQNAGMPRQLDQIQPANARDPCTGEIEKLR
jgi:hypothetical protein